nr:G5 domain-containing protein [Neobacillus terrae]
MAGLGKDQAEEIAALKFPGIDINVDAFTKKLNIVASSLSEGENVINLKEFIKNSDESSSICESVLTPKTAPDEVERAVGQLAKIQVHANSTFSFNELLKKEKLNNLSGNTLSFIASGIYKAILPTNFSIIERNIGRELPDYTELGYEAKIDFAQKDDLVFSNPNESDFNIEISWDGKQLKTSLVGQKLFYEYKITETDKQQFMPKTVLQYSPLLAGNQKKVLKEGSEGYLIRITREIYENANFKKSVLLSEDYYAPVPKITVRAILAAVEPATDTSQQVTGETVADQKNKNEDMVGTNAGPGNSDPQSNTKMPSNQQKSSQGESTENLWGKPNEEPK